MHLSGMTVKEGNRAAGTRSERIMIMAGAFGALLAAICCAMPLLVVLLGAIGLNAWIAKADYVLIPALILCLGLVGFRLYRKGLHKRQEAK